MKSMGKILLLMMGIFSFTSAQADLKVFTCEPEWAALAKELGGEHVDVYTATTAFQDPHHIQARPSLIAQLRRADLAICTGAELEIGWLPMLQRQAGNERVQDGRPGLFMAAMQVERLDVPQVVDRSMGDVHAAGNPHVHLDPYRLLSIATQLGQRLQTLDEENREHYAQLLAGFSQRWEAAVANWEQRAIRLQGAEVVTQHTDWTYLLSWLGMKVVGTLEPKPGVPPSAAHLASLRQQLQDRPVRMVIRAAYQDKRPSEWLSEQMNIPAVELPFTVGGSDRAVNLFTLYDDTLDRLLAALP